jgi:thiamine biosynthesis protein ThiS
MVTVNGKPVELADADTITALLEELGFVWPMLVVKVNGKLVRREDFARTEVADGDTIDVIHMMSGG